VTVNLRFGAYGDDKVLVTGQLMTRVMGQCQRCLEPVTTLVEFDREFRFVESEEAALAQDEDSEEDLLVQCPQFDLLELVEDELLMALPVSPKHEKCPGDLKLSAADADFERAPDRPNPFAKLAQLKTPKS
jgi:uncharacterized protein